MTLEQITALQAGKTGALIQFSAEAGAVIAGADPAPLRAYLGDVSQETMDINAPVISGSDPGAVPGGSTKNPSLGAEGAETGSTNV